MTSIQSNAQSTIKYSISLLLELPYMPESVLQTLQFDNSDHREFYTFQRRVSALLLNCNVLQFLPDRTLLTHGLAEMGF